MHMVNEHIGWALWALNVTTGCSWNCPFCYAREIAGLRYVQGFVPTIHPERLLAPANTKIPAHLADDPAARRVFLGSMTDWMDPHFPDAVVQAVLDMCAANPEFEFMTLTKQAARLKDFTFPDNVWVGATVTRQGQAKEVEDAFASIDAAVRWISFEPLHGHVELEHPENVDLFVIGVERETDQRRGNVKGTAADWVDSLRLQARRVGAAIWEKENMNVRLREMPTPRR
jgi:protein gp37